MPQNKLKREKAVFLQVFDIVLEKLTDGALSTIGFEPDEALNTVWMDLHFKTQQDASYTIDVTDCSPCKQAKDALLSSYLSKEDQRSIFSAFSKVEDDLRLAFPSDQRVGGPFPAENKIYRVLFSYEALLQTLYLQFEQIAAAGLIDSLITPALDWGYSFSNTSDASGNIGGVQQYSPMYLLGLQYVYRELREFSKTVVDARSGCCDSVETKQVVRLRNQTFCSILDSKVLRVFRWYVLPMAKEKSVGLCQAALPFFSRNSQEEDLNIPIRPFADYSSYEGISELRLKEKIEYELERLQPLNAIGEVEYSICIIGDVNPGRIEELCLVLNRSIPLNDRLAKKFQEKSLYLSFDVYTKTFFEPKYQHRRRVTSFEKTVSETPRLIGCSYCFHEYSDELKNGKKLSSLVKKFDLLFLLDCTDLYLPITTKPLENPGSFRQKLLSERLHASQARGEVSFYDRGAQLTDLYNVLAATAWNGEQPSVFCKQENLPMLQFLADRIQEENESARGVQRSAYIYISDPTVQEHLFWKGTSLTFLRRENYNCKQIAILHSGSWRDGKLKSKSNDSDGSSKTVVFDLCQFVKHISLDRKEDFLTFLNGKEFSDKKNEWEALAYSLLSHIVIGIDYENWPDQLILSYAFCPFEQGEDALQNLIFNFEMCFGKIDCFKNRLESIIQKILVPFFNKEMETNSLFYRYYKEAVTSFLYSDAKSVDDMLFLHLFREQPEKIGEARFEKVNNDIRNSLCCGARKYSKKRSYQEVMRDYDSPSEIFRDKFAKLERMQRIESVDTNEVFQNIIEACKNNHYENSYLYLNCKKML